MADMQAEIGIIGGSGFYRMRGLDDVIEAPVDTPFGPPSDAVLIGTLGGRRVAFVARHGRGHHLSPSELPARANLWALKRLGVQRLISVSAVGSMREAIAPGHMGVPDQLIDRTMGRPRTFFSDGIVAHVAFAEPYCPALRRALVAAAGGAGTVHDGGALIIIEGPQFSTRAESELFRGWGTSYVGMTALPEARLAREAEICYATLALVTDYDCWHDSHETVSADLVVRTLSDVAARAAGALGTLIPTLPTQADAGCACGQALDHAIVTAPEHISAAVRARLNPIISKYID